MTGLYVAEVVPMGVVPVEEPDEPAVDVTPHPREIKRRKSSAAICSLRRGIGGARSKRNPKGKHPATKSIGWPGLDPLSTLAAAMVVIVTVAEAVTPLVSWSDAGLMVQVELVGAEVQVKATGPVEPAAGVSCSI